MEYLCQALLIKEAGRKCGSINHQEVDYSKIKKIIIATNKNIHTDYKNLLN